MFVAGIDIGSVAAKAIIMEGDTSSGMRRVAGRGVQPTGWNTTEVAQEVITRACLDAAIKQENIKYIVATGYGRVSIPFASKSITEISCHARGAAYLFPHAGVVLDIGGQDSKAISLEPWEEGKKLGTVKDFLMNDKCAAGTGRFLQVLSGILGMPLDELGAAASRGNPVAISSMCAVFAETEIVGLLAKGTAPNDIAAGVFHSIARRMCGLARRVAMHGECVFTGGLAMISSFASILSEELNVPVNVPNDPQTIGALGAALIAYDFLEKKDNENHNGS